MTHTTTADIDTGIAATAARLGDLMRIAETGEDWAEISRIEDELAKLRRKRAERETARIHEGRRKLMRQMCAPKAKEF